MRTGLRILQACPAAALYSMITVTTQACAPTTATPVAIPSARERPAIDAQDVVFETSVVPQPDEDLAAPCRYELTLTNPSRSVQGVWVIFERSGDMLRYYQDPDVRAFARNHDLALLYPFHCQSKIPGYGGDMNVDPLKGIGRALFAALAQLAQTSGHPELASAKMILLGFSGTGSLVGRLTAFAPDRVLAAIPTDPGHFDPLGMDTIILSPAAAAIPQLIIVGSADAVSGTQRPYAYFRRYFDQGASWTFVVQNRAPHCCIMNAKALVLLWLDAVVIKGATRNTGWYGFIETKPTESTDCPAQSSPPARASWCRSQKDTWGGANWSVNTASIKRSSDIPQGMMPAGWLPTDTFAKQWVWFITQPEHPVTLPP